MMKRLFSLALILVVLSFSSSVVFAANEASQTFTLDGQLFHVGSTSPLIDSAAQLKVQILDPSETCVLYEETQTVNTTSTEGYFNIQVGSLPGASKRSGLDPAQTMSLVIQNVSAIPASNAPGQTCASSTYTPAPGDTRYFRITVIPSTGSPDVLTPDMVLDSVPSAIVAQSVQGLDKSNILHTNTTSPAGEVLTQANLESLFTPTAFANLAPVLAGNYLQTSANGAALPSFATAPAAPIAGDVWYDSTGKNLVYYDGTTSKILGTSGAGLSSLTVSARLTANGAAGGTLSAPGTIDLNTVGTAGTYVKVTTDAYGRVTGNSALVEADIPTLSTAGKVSGAAINTGTIAGNAAINTTGNLQTTSDITTKRFFMYDHGGVGPNYVGMQTVADLTAAGGSSYTMTWPDRKGSANQVLTTDGSGNLSWAAPTSGAYVLKAGDTMTGPLVNNSNSASTALAVAQSGAGYAATFMGGNVGIGTTSPAANLSVIGGGSATNPGSLSSFSSGPFQTSGNMYGINIDKSGTETLYLGINKDSVTGNVPANAVYMSTYTGNHPISIGRGSSGAPYNNDILIDTTGYVGVGGVSSPSSALDINGAQTIEEIAAASKPAAAAGKDFIYADNTSHTLKVSLNGGAYVDLATTATTGNYVLKSGDTMTGPLNNNSNSASTALAVAQSGAGYAATFMGGNVGIGTTTPASKLYVSGGDFKVDATGSSTASPRLFGLDNMNPGTAARFQFGDYANAVQTTQSGRLQLTSYWGTEIYGNAESGSALGFASGSSSDPSLNVYGSTTGAAVIVATAASGQTGNIQEWRNSSGTPISVVNSAGNIGVGTSSPSSTLDINGAQTVREIAAASAPTAAAGKDFIYADNTSHTLKVSLNGGAYVDLATTATTGNYVLKSGDTMTGPLNNNSNSASTALAVAQSGAGYAATFTGGNVGVGTSTPAHNLDIAGDFNLTKTTGATNIATFTGSNGSTVIDQYGNFIATGLNAQVGMQATGIVSMQIKNNASKDWRIENTRTSTAGTLEFTNLTDAIASPRMVISPAGSVGIGTISPSSTLDINGAQTIEEIAAASAPAVAAGKDFIYADNTSHTLKVSLNGGAYADLATTSTTGNYVLKAGDTMTGPLVNNSNSASTALAITQSGAGNAATFMGGKVGFGTTSPSSTLSDGNGLGVDSAGNSVMTSGIDWYGNSGGYVAGFYNNASGANGNGLLVKVSGNTAANSALAVDQGGTEGGAGTSLFRVNGNGNVGIGTTAPTSKLHINGGAIRTDNDNVWNDNYLFSASNTAYQGPRLVLARARGTLASQTYPLNGDNLGIIAFRNQYIGASAYGSAIVANATENQTASNNGSDLEFMTVPNGSFVYQQRMTITQAGNIGIGTTSPSSILDINGAQTVEEIAAASAPAAAAGKDFIYADNASHTLKASLNGAAYADILTGAAASGSYVAKAGDTMTGPLANNSNSASTALAVAQSGAGYAATFTGGYVGIGTTSPSLPLEVDNATTATDVLAIKNTSASGYSGIEFLNNSGTLMATMGYSNASAAGFPSTFYVNTKSAAAPIVLAINNSEKMRVNTNGNIGIGSTSPSSILDINGAQTVREIASASAPAAAAAKDFFYADNTSHTLKLSANGGAYSDILTAAGGSMTGLLVLSGDPSNVLGAATKEYVDAATGAGTYVAKAGDTMTGPLVNNSNSASTALKVTQAGSGYSATFTGGNVGISTAAPVSTLHVAAAPTASANYGLVSLGSGAFDGSSAGKFVGSSNGTVVAANTASGYTGNFVDYQVAGTSKFSVDSTGLVTAAGTISAGYAYTNFLTTPNIYGGTAASGNLSLYSTQNATQGYVLIAPTGGKVGIATTSPETTLDVNGPATLRQAYYENVGALGSLGCGATDITAFTTNLYTLTACASGTTTLNIPTITGWPSGNMSWTVTFFVTGQTASVFNVSYNGATTAVYWDKNSTGGTGGASYAGFTVPSGSTDLISCAVLNTGSVKVFCGVAAQY